MQSPGDELVLCSPHHPNYGSDSFGSTSTIMNTSFPHGFHRSANSRSPVAYAPSAEASYKISRHESDTPNDSNAFLLPQLPPLSLPSPSFPTQEQMQTQPHAFEHSRSATPLHLPASLTCPPSPPHGRVRLHASRSSVCKPSQRIAAFAASPTRAVQCRIVGPDHVAIHTRALAPMG